MEDYTLTNPDFETCDINLCVSWYIISSYLYYQKDISIIADSSFDYICKRLLSEWDNITHIHKKFIDKQSLSAGSGFDLEYPKMAISSSLYIAEKRNLL